MMSHLPGSFRLVESDVMTILVEDWSLVRSPARAARRRRKHRQNIVYRQVPRTDVLVHGDMIVGHPETLKKFLASIPMAEQHG